MPVVRSMPRGWPRLLEAARPLQCRAAAGCVLTRSPPLSLISPLPQEINQGYSEDGMGGGFGRGGFGGGFGGFDEEDLFAHMFASQAGGGRRYSGARGGGSGGSRD